MVGVRRFLIDSKLFRKSCGFIIHLEGENTSAYSFGLPRISEDMMSALSIEFVIPHLLKPVATYKSGVFFE